MTRRSTIRTPSVRESGLLLEAAALLLFVRLFLRWLPYRTLRGLLERYGRWHRRAGALPVASLQTDTARRVAWAIGATARRLPVSTTCLGEALVAETLLRRRGRDPTLRFGVRPPAASSGLDAHAWVECDGQVVVGGQVDLAAYTALCAAGRS